MANLDDLSGPQFGETEPTQRLHMDENIFRALAARQKAEALDPVEPFDHGRLPVAFRDHRDMRALGQLRWMNGRALIHAQDAEGLQSAIAFEHFADDARPLICGLIAVAAQHRYMEENVGHPVIRNDEAEPLRRIEPFDVARDDCNVDAGLFGCFAER
jgi:hypothetical protein